MLNVQRFSAGLIVVNIDKDDLTRQIAQRQRIRDGRSDESGTDYSNLAVAGSVIHLGLFSEKLFINSTSFSTPSLGIAL